MSKILYAASTMSHINNFHQSYINALRRDGHEVLVMARGEDADFDIPFVKKMFSPKNAACCARIRKIIKREKFDTIILNTALAAFLVRLAMPKRRRPRVVNIVHGYLFPEHLGSSKAKLLLKCEKMMTKKTDSIIVMNEEDLRIAKEHKLCLGDIHVIDGMGAKTRAEVSPTAKIRKYIESEGKYVLSFVGELSDRKNQRFLICALPEIKIAIPNAVLWLIGAGGGRDELIDLAEKLGLSDSVYFIGQTEIPCDFIRASDLYVSSSEIEGMPFNIIEALGTGKTILASNIKGHTDLIKDGESGFLYEYGNITEFVKKVKQIHDGELATDPEKIKEAYERYSYDNVYPKTCAVIKEAIKG